MKRLFIMLMLFISIPSIQSVQPEDSKEIIIEISELNDNKSENLLTNIPLLARVTCLLDRISHDKASPFLNNLIIKSFEKILPNFFSW